MRGSQAPCRSPANFSVNDALQDCIDIGGRLLALGGSLVGLHFLHDRDSRLDEGRALQKLLHILKVPSGNHVANIQHANQEILT